MDNGNNNIMYMIAFMNNNNNNNIKCHVHIYIMTYLILLVYDFLQTLDDIICHDRYHAVVNNIITEISLYHFGYTQAMIIHVHIQ